MVQKVSKSRLFLFSLLRLMIGVSFSWIRAILIYDPCSLPSAFEGLKNREPGLEDKLPKLRRSLFTLGLFCKHFSFSDLGFPENTEERILNTFLYYIHQKAVRDDELKARALDGVGFFCSTHYKLMLGKQVAHFDVCHVGSRDFRNIINIQLIYNRLPTKNTLFIRQLHLAVILDRFLVLK